MKLRLMENNVVLIDDDHYIIIPNEMFEGMTLAGLIKRLTAYENIKITIEPKDVV